MQDLETLRGQTAILGKTGVLKLAYGLVDAAQGQAGLRRDLALTRFWNLTQCVQHIELLYRELHIDSGVQTSTI